MSKRKDGAGDLFAWFVDTPGKDRWRMLWHAIYDHAHGDKRASDFLTMVGRTMTWVEPQRRRPVRGHGRDGER